MRASDMIMASIVASVLAFGAINVAHALDFKAVGAAPVIFYDAPSEKGRRVAIAPRGMPVEVVLTYGDWTKVRDASGDLSWVQTAGLSGSRTLQVKVANAKIRATPSDTAPQVFSADKGVLLELVEPVVSGWVKVRHRDGQSGYVKATEVWGS
ncbi:SH3 domain-containing protein [Glaciimonas immobilis]|nr:SH3 domain-containing protein [Glaciimonas immobilis]KAF3997341.1 SH3 domain-containing protein [Glaciimonas immobilis]